MKAWILDAPGEVEQALALCDVPDPTPGPGELLVRVSVCGLCRTDLHIVLGEIELPRLPIIPGHQVVGTVVSGGSRFEPGERVGLAWLHETCGTCADCEREDENLCRHARFTGYHAHGGYAEYVTVPEAFAYARHLFGERTLRTTTASTRADGEALLAIAAEGAIHTHVVEVPFVACPSGLADILADRVQGSAVLRVGTP